MPRSTPRGSRQERESDTKRLPELEHGLEGNDAERAWGQSVWRSSSAVWVLEQRRCSGEGARARGRGEDGAARTDWIVSFRWLGSDGFSRLA
ncbi:hypothetical protein M0R45_015204 [Rubus argutus]|uniref:Uncharacterized protein n=1 Tax=Rubus argutus TaxID=59490 RepID=A0AAW1XQ40_RUBAR